MGETGCGKTKLIDFMCRLQVPTALREKLVTMDIVKVCKLNLNNKRGLVVVTMVVGVVVVVVELVVVVVVVVVVVIVVVVVVVVVSGSGGRKKFSLTKL